MDPDFHPINTRCFFFFWSSNDGYSQQSNCRVFFALIYIANSKFVLHTFVCERIFYCILHRLVKIRKSLFYFAFWCIDRKHKRDRQTCIRLHYIVDGRWLQLKQYSIKIFQLRLLHFMVDETTKRQIFLWRITNSR